MLSFIVLQNTRIPLSCLRHVSFFFWGNDITSRYTTASSRTFSADTKWFSVIPIGCISRENHSSTAIAGQTNQLVCAGRSLKLYRCSLPHSRSTGAVTFDTSRRVISLLDLVIRANLLYWKLPINLEFLCHTIFGILKCIIPFHDHYNLIFIYENRDHLSNFKLYTQVHSVTFWLRYLLRWHLIQWYF